MKLIDYLKREKLTYVEFAKHLDCTPITLFKILKGFHFPRIGLARMIVELTDGEVTLEDIYKDKPKKPLCPHCGHKLGKARIFKAEEFSEES